MRIATLLLCVVYVIAAEDQPVREVPGSQPAASKAYTYKKTKGADLQIHVHFPPGWKSADRRPAIVFFFGGGWTHGSAEQFSPQADYLAQRGMVAARADYRVGSRHGVGPDRCVEDAKSAVRWVRKNAADLGIDPDRIAASGGSAGGHLAACTGLTDGPEAEGEDRAISSMANALILFNPVLDTTHERVVARLRGDESLARDISPYLHLRKNGPPTQILFGTEDRLIQQAPPFIARAKELGNRVELYTAEGQQHGFFNRSPWLERTIERADQFLVEIGYLPRRLTTQAAGQNPPASRPAR